MTEVKVPIGTTAYNISVGERGHCGATAILSNGDGSELLRRPTRDGVELNDFITLVRDWVGQKAGILDIHNAWIQAALQPFAPNEARPNRENQEGKADKTGKDSGLVLMRDLAKEEEATVDWAWGERFATGSFDIIAGRPKAGKSTLARRLALAFSRKESFLGFDTAGGTVLWLALEERRQHVRRSFVAMGAAHEPIAFHIGPAPQAEWEGWLRSMISDVAPGLVVIDHLQRLLRLSDINDYAESGNKVEPLVNIARETGACVVALHHTGKAERSDEGDDLLGSTSLYGAVDCLLTVKRDNQGRRTISTRQREGDDLPTMLLRMDDAGEIALAGEMATVRRNSAKMEIAQAIGQKTLTLEDIREGVGLNQNEVVRALHEMIEEGTVVRSGTGKKGSPFLYGSASRP